MSHSLRNSTRLLYSAQNPSALTAAPWYSRSSLLFDLDVQHGAVHLPKELEGREQDRRLALRPLRVRRHGRQQYRLGVPVVQVDVVVLRGRLPRGPGGRVAPVRRLPRAPALGLGPIDEVPYDPLEAAGGLGLAEVAVLVQPVLGLAGAAEVEAEVEVEYDDLLVGGGPRLVAPGGEDLVEEGERRLGLGYGVQLGGPAEGIFRFVEEGVVGHGWMIVCVLSMAPLSSR